MNDARVTDECHAADITHQVERFSSLSKNDRASTDLDCHLSIAACHIHASSAHLSF
jgi:hypothetical protein